MKKRVGIILLVILLGLTGIFLYGAAKRNFELTIMDGDTVLLQKNYNIKMGTRLKIFFLNKNDYNKFYEEQEDKNTALDQLNISLRTDIDQIADGIDCPPKDATVKWDKREFTYEAEADGVLVDRDDIVKKLFANMDKKIVIELKKLPIKPSVTEKELRDITQQTGSFATNYSNSSPERKHNIGLAVSMIDGTIIGVGERFSFNETVGERTLERGFLEAKIISSGHFVKGVGGGVCQVSTTLYNTVLRSGLKIVKVSGHSLPVGYVPLSFDAMVSSASDFVFENISGHPVYIKGESDGNNLSFTFYGINLNKGRTTVFRTEIIKVLVCDEYEDICDSNQLAPDENFKVLSPPKSGYVSEAYMDIYEGQALKRSVKLRRDTYIPQKGVRIVRAICQDS